MAKKGRAYLKSRFETGDVPTQQDYEDFIDSSYNDEIPFNNKYYVKTTGNDSTAVVNDPTLPYLTIKAAALAAYTDQQANNNWNQVYVFEGVYNEHSIAYPEIEMFFEDWAIVYHATISIINDLNAAGHFMVRGKGRWYTEVIKPSDDQDGINFSKNGSSCDIQGDEVSSVQNWSNPNTGLERFIFRDLRILTKPFVSANRLECVLNIFKGCDFVNGIYEGDFNKLSVCAFDDVNFILPSVAEAQANFVIKDKGGSTLFTITKTGFETSVADYDLSLLTQQQVVDEPYVDASTDNPNQVAAIDFQQAESGFILGGSGLSGGKQVWNFTNCRVLIRRDKGIGIRIIQSNYDYTKGGFFFNGITIKREVTNAVKFVNCRSGESLTPVVVHLNGIVDNCTVDRMTRTGYIDNILGDQSKLSIDATEPNTWYVNTNGDDENVGNASFPFATIQAAHDAAAEEDVIYIQNTGGVLFNEDVSITKDIVFSGPVPSDDTNKWTTILFGTWTVTNGKFIAFKNVSAAMDLVSTADISVNGYSSLFAGTFPARFTKLVMYECNLNIKSANTDFNQIIARGSKITGSLSYTCDVGGKIDFDATSFETNINVGVDSPIISQLKNSSIGGDFTHTGDLIKTNSVIVGNVNVSGTTTDNVQNDTTKLSKTETAPQPINSNVAVVGNTITFTATPNFGFTNGNVQKMILTGNVTSLSISNELDSGSYRIFLEQDGVGGRTITGVDTSLGTKTDNSVSNFITAANDVNIIDIAIDPDGTTYYSIETITA